MRDLSRSWFGDLCFVDGVAEEGNSVVAVFDFAYGFTPGLGRCFWEEAHECANGQGSAVAFEKAVIGWGLRLGLVRMLGPLLEAS